MCFRSSLEVEWLAGEEGRTILASHDTGADLGGLVMGTHCRCGAAIPSPVPLDQHLEG